LETAFDEVVLALPDFPPFPAIVLIDLYIPASPLNFNQLNPTLPNPANQILAP
jgi:hypothetical protein